MMWGRAMKLGLILFTLIMLINTAAADEADYGSNYSDNYSTNDTNIFNESNNEQFSNTIIASAWSLNEYENPEENSQLSKIFNDSSVVNNILFTANSNVQQNTSLFNKKDDAKQNESDYTTFYVLTIAFILFILLEKKERYKRKNKQ